MDLISTSYYSQYALAFGIVLLAAVLFMLGIYLARPIKSKVAEVKDLVGHISSKPRVRKRDKVILYGRKVLRNVSSVKEKVKFISGQVRGPPGRKRKLVMKLARRLLPLRHEQLPAMLKVLEPPAEYLQEDVSESLDQRLPPEVIYMLQNIRIFGHFEKPLFLELLKHLQIVNYMAGQYLFSIGDPDVNIYIVQSGKLGVYITETDSSVMPLKIVKPGESVSSLLSVADVLTGQPSVFKTVSARALEDTSVLQLPVSAFQDVFQKQPDALIRVIQIIMVRLQRVTFLALHQYLGLSAELVKSSHSGKSSSATSSPMIKLRLRDPAFARGTVDEVGFLTPPPSESRHRVPREEAEHDELLKTAIVGFSQLLGLEDDKLLVGNVQVRDLNAGTYIIKEDSQKDAALIYVLSGTLSVSQKAANKNEDVMMFTAHAGELVGGLAVLTGEPSFFTVRSRHTACVGMLSKSTFYSIMANRPQVVLHVARTVIRRLSPFVRQIDFALEWVYIESGRALYRQSDESDCTYIVLSGRLRSVITQHNGRKELVGDYGRGDLVGIVETLTQTQRSTTVMAVRDTELAKLPEGLLNAIKLKFPMVVSRLINLLGHRILGTWQTPSLGPTLQQRPTVSSFSTVAIIPVSDDVPLTNFATELHAALSRIGATSRLTSDYIRRNLGPRIMDSTNEYRLSSWLGQQEDQHRIVLYQCDNALTPWTQRCIRQADCILIVALADTEPTVGTIEKQLDSIAIRTQKELILLHKEDAPLPTNTVAWLNARSWCSSHHHIRCPPKIFVKKHTHRAGDHHLRNNNEATIHSDFSRLARLLTGESVGLVLGGGGAKGAAHVGMIRAIQEAGIPIDMVGGVSIGAFMGALWCAERDVNVMKAKARGWSFKMTQLWRQIWDLTYPVTSMFSGAGFNLLIREMFSEEIQIEDLWLPYFAVTTDITSSSMRVHTHGSLWRYVRSSMSLSGYMPPLCDPVDGHLLLDGGYVNNLPGPLWRYVRASMTIAGLLPPLCDPLDGHLLLDGCYINNVPADVMRSRGAKHILAIDVGSQDESDLTYYGDSLSGWWLLWKKWNPFSSPVKVPSLPEIQSRLAYVSCVRQLEEVKNSDYCEYIRPPIDKYKTLQFGSFDEIHDVGYNHGKTYFAGLQRAGLLNGYASSNRIDKSATPSSDFYNNISPFHPAVNPQGPHTFTDLAEMVAKVRRPAASSDFSSSSDDEDAEDQHGTPAMDNFFRDDLTGPLRSRRRNSRKEAADQTQPEKHDG